jgi:uncharacterized protein YjbI with pentapeptide repeats
VITQPLPRDLRNQSFCGLDCAGWDFAKRDLRGCDFRNANLNGANLSQVIGSKSQKQIVAMIAGAVAGVITGVFASHPCRLG